MKPLTDEERQLAYAAARVIETAEEVGLPDAPDKLVTSPTAIRVLARSYLELRRQLHSLCVLAEADAKATIAEALGTIGRSVDRTAKLHGKLWQPIDSFTATLEGTVSVRVHNVLVLAGVSYVGELIQADRKTLVRLRNVGKGSVRAIEKVLAQQGLSLGQALEDWPGPRWECRAERPFFRKIGPQVVTSLPVAPTDTSSYVSYPRDPTTLTEVRATEGPSTGDPLVALYCRVMGDIETTFLKYKTFVVRHWDGMDGCWTDCTGEIDRDHALHYWSERTDGGKRQVSYAEIDYYRIFPGGTRMNWDGSEGRELHRQGNP